MPEAKYPTTPSSQDVKITTDFANWNAATQNGKLSAKPALWTDPYKEEQVLAVLNVLYAEYIAKGVAVCSENFEKITREITARKPTLYKRGLFYYPQAEGDELKQYVETFLWNWLSAMYAGKLSIGKYDCKSGSTTLPSVYAGNEPPQSQTALFLTNPWVVGGFLAVIAGSWYWVWKRQR